VGEHPFALMTLDFSPAGLLCGAPPDAKPKIDAWLIPSPQFDDRFAKLPLSASLFYNISTNRYARMLAKIAHSYAVAICGFGTFDAILPEIILGHAKDIYRSVGGAIVDLSEDSDELHRLSIRTYPGLITVYIRLFAFMGAPAYEIAVGRPAWRR
jgi:hypothetical protein